MFGYINEIKNCFNLKETHNVGQYDFDLAKGMAFIFLIWLHTLKELSGLFGSTSTTFVKIVDLLGGPCAMPIYFICVGIGIVYSENNTEELEHEGLHLLIVGIILNIFKNVVPYVIDGITLGTEIEFTHIFCGLFEGDILQFLALSFITMGLLVKVNNKKRVMITLAVVLSIAGYFLKYVSTGSVYFDVILGWFWGTGELSELPMFNWFIFPVFGYIFGTVMRHCKDRKAFYKLVAPISLIVGASYFILSSYYDVGVMALGTKNYVFMSIIDAFFSCVLAVGIFGIDCVLNIKYKKSILKPLFKISSNVSSIEVVHWVIIMAFVTVLHHFYLKNIGNSEIFITLIALVVLILSETIADNFRKKKQSNN